MPRSEMSPADLDGKALRRWYQRSPQELERQRRAAAEAARWAYFGGQNFARSPPELEMAQELRGRGGGGGDDDFQRSDERQSPSQAFPRPGSWRQDSKPNWSGGIRPVPLPSPTYPGGGSLRPLPLPSLRLSPSGIRPIPLAPAGPNGSFSRAAGYPPAPLEQPTSRASSGPAIPTSPSQPQPKARPERHDVWIKGRQPGDIDPSRTNVFQTGPDGKLPPGPGWQTTGPFDFGKWAKKFDWVGVAGDLTDITAGALDFMSGAGLVKGVFEGLGYKFGPEVVQGIIEGHHGWPKFMGGPTKQKLADLYHNIHTMYHDELAAALKQAGFPRIGGRGGGTKDWARYFEENPAREREALDILRRVTRDFDKRNNTKISNYLDRALAKGKPSTSPPPD